MPQAMTPLGGLIILAIIAVPVILVLAVIVGIIWWLI